jgi:hypothetical protein
MNKRRSAELLPLITLLTTFRFQQIIDYFWNLVLLVTDADRDETLWTLPSIDWPFNLTHYCPAMRLLCFQNLIFCYLYNITPYTKNVVTIRQI